MQYLGFIDGLRAIAVLAVVLYHVGFKQIPGGFVGVDVFFVISGFLISAIILREIGESTFTLRAFYARRLRRLLPILAVVLLTTLALSPVFLQGAALRQVTESAMSVSVFMSNVYFWQTEDYFALSALNRPLLHTWSLGVEEQFYMIFPLLLLLAARLGRNKLGMLVAIITVASLSLSVTASAAYPAASFYLLPARMWEFGLGALLAINLPALSRMNDVPSNVLGIVGVLLLGYGLLTISGQDVFPGYAALYPVVGTVCIIAGGLNQNTWLSRLLCLRPLRYIGLISYSLYLWHWVIIVFAAQALQRALTLTDQLLLIALMFVVSSLGFHLIEKPFRTRPALLKIPGIRGGFGLLVFVFLVSVICRSWYSGFDSAKGGDDLARRLEAFAKVPSCAFGAQSIAASARCAMGEGEKTFILWGDSHAQALIPAFEVAAEDPNWRGLSGARVGCPPMFGVYFAANRERCSGAYAAGVRKYILNNPVDHVFLVARWPMYETGVRYRGHFQDKFPPFVSDEMEVGDTPESSARILARNLVSTVEFLTARGIPVTIMAPVPVLPFKIEKYNETSQPLTRDEYLAQRQAIDVTLVALSANPLVSILDPGEVLCPDTHCRLFEGGEPLYIDHNHLSVRGAKLLAPAVLEVLNVTR